MGDRELSKSFQPAPPERMPDEFPVLCRVGYECPSFTTERDMTAEKLIAADHEAAVADFPSDHMPFTPSEVYEFGMADDPSPVLATFSNWSTGKLTVLTDRFANFAAACRFAETYPRKLEWVSFDRT